MTEQPRDLRGTRIGIADPVTPAWGGYERREVEAHAREVHYDVLRSSGFGRERAREISSASSEQQAHLLDEHRGETLRPAALRPPREPSGFDIRSVICGLDRDGG